MSTFGTKMRFDFTTLTAKLMRNAIKINEFFRGN
jgi:hypothetical protein